MNTRSPLIIQVQYQLLSKSPRITPINPMCANTLMTTQCNKSYHMGPPKASDPNLKRFKYNFLVEWETEKKTYQPSSSLAADALVIYDTNAKEHDLSSIEDCQRLKNLAKRDKHDLSRLPSPKGEMKSSFSWTNLLKSPTSSTLCFGEPTLGKLNQVHIKHFM